MLNPTGIDDLMSAHHNLSNLRQTFTLILTCNNAVPAQAAVQVTTGPAALTGQGSDRLSFQRAGTGLEPGGGFPLRVNVLTVARWVVLLSPPWGCRWEVGRGCGEGWGRPAGQIRLEHGDHIPVSN